MTKIILVVLVISATLTECIMMRKSREYDAADNIAGLKRCVKAMVVLGFVGIAADLVSSLRRGLIDLMRCGKEMRKNGIFG